MSTEASHLSPLKVRQMGFVFAESIPKHWLDNNAYKTHLLNSLTLFLPDVEHYLNRTIKKAQPQINDPALKIQTQGFVGQEGQHAKQHGKFWQNLQQQGYTIAPFLKTVKTLLHRVEQLSSLSLNLAIGAGLEHLTTLMASLALEEDFLDHAEPTMKELFEWHAIEEIEHRSVVFDVFQAVSKNYFFRLLGLIISHILVLGMLNAGVFILLWQDKKLFDWQVWQNAAQFWLFKDKFLFKAARNAGEYIKPNFHPSHRDFAIALPSQVWN